MRCPVPCRITKDARITPGKNIDRRVLESKSFEFEIRSPLALADKTLTADVRNAQNEVVAEVFDMIFERWQAPQTLKDDETLTSTVSMRVPSTR